MTELKMRCTVLEAEQLPARVPNLRARLAHVDEDRLTHGAWLSVTSRKLEERRARRFLHRGPRGKKLSHRIRSPTLGSSSIQMVRNYGLNRDHVQYASCMPPSQELRRANRESCNGQLNIHAA